MTAFVGQHIELHLSRSISSTAVRSSQTRQDTSAMDTSGLSGPEQAHMLQILEKKQASLFRQRMTLDLTKIALHFVDGGAHEDLLESRRALFYLLL